MNRRRKMGDRGLVFFHAEEDLSPCVYLHWHGAAVPTLVEELKKLMGNRLGDVPYTCARFIGICHDRISGNTSLGVWNASVKTPQEVRDKAEELSHGDNGVWLINCSTWEVEHLDY